MAWTEQWSIVVDGVELNSAHVSGPSGAFFTYIPELENEFEQEVIAVPIEGDYPVAVRMQPREGQYTFMIAMRPCDWATYQTRLQTLKTALSAGAHTLTVQVRGMTAAMSVDILVTSMMIEPKQRSLTVTAYVPRPVLS